MKNKNKFRKWNICKSNWLYKRRTRTSKRHVLLTTKPILYIANVSEEQIEDPENDENVKKVKEYALKENAEVIPLCVKIEEELSGLDDNDKKEMLEALGLEESGLDKVIKKAMIY